MKEEEKFYEMVSRCADTAISQMGGLACQGIVSGAELYYGKDTNGNMGLFLVPLACTFGPYNPEWTPTGRILSSATPYNQYARWITSNSRDLPLFPRECQCESSTHSHGSKSCKSAASLIVNTTYGKFEMCADCAKQIPQEFLK